jgi:hypothetical protein
MTTPVRTSWIRRREALQIGALLVVALASWRLTATYALLSHTVDEPTHISSGLEWLETGTQRLHPENPPLGRIGAGVGSWLAGRALPPTGTAPQRGTELLYAADRYLSNLRSARLATLPFFLLMALVVWRWSDQVAGPRAAFVATVAVCSLPPVLAHAGLATTDVPFAALFVLSVWALVGWIEAPGAARSIGLGVALGAALATKFSTLLFFPPVALVALLSWGLASRGGPRPDWARMVVGALVVLPAAILVLWAAYRFDVGRLDGLAGAARVIESAFPDPESAGRTLAEQIARLPLPAPGAIHGLLFLKAHTVLGHSAYALGQESEHGFWYFYPLALAVKTPFSFLLLLALGLVGGLRQEGRRAWRSLAPALAAMAILAVSMLSTLNIGLRHVLALYPLLAVTAGLGTDALLTTATARRRTAIVALAGVALVWQLALVFTTFPDYLAYFNPLAGRDPGRVLVDSDLDWGQDALRLEEVVGRLDVPLLNIAYFGSVRLCELELPELDWLPPGEPVKGWVAISEMYYRDHWRVTYSEPCDRTRGAGRAAPGASYDWLRHHRPVAFAGRSIRLYRIGSEGGHD